MNRFQISAQECRGLPGLPTFCRSISTIKHSPRSLGQRPWDVVPKGGAPEDLQSLEPAQVVQRWWTGQSACARSPRLLITLLPLLQPFLPSDSHSTSTESPLSQALPRGSFSAHPRQACSIPSTPALPGHPHLSAPSPHQSQLLPPSDIRLPSPSPPCTGTLRRGRPARGTWSFSCRQRRGRACVQAVPRRRKQTLPGEQHQRTPEDRAGGGHSPGVRRGRDWGGMREKAERESGDGEARRRRSKGRADGYMWAREGGS